MTRHQTQTTHVSPLYLRTIGWAYLAEHLPNSNWSSQAALELGTLIAEGGNESKAFERWLMAGAM